MLQKEGYPVFSLLTQPPEKTVQMDLLSWCVPSINSSSVNLWRESSDRDTNKQRCKSWGHPALGYSTSVICSTSCVMAEEQGKLVLGSSIDTVRPLHAQEGSNGNEVHKRPTRRKIALTSQETVQVEL